MTTIKFEDGAVFVGDVAKLEGNHVVAHGKGKCNFPEGRVYEGEWEQNHMSGMGTCIYPPEDGSGYKSYEGEWKEGHWHGHATVQFVDGTCYTGRCQWGHLHGYGICDSADGARYAGEWSEGKRTGRGVLQSADGESYNGVWENDMFHGAGRYNAGRAEGHAEFEEYDGQWHHHAKHGYGVHKNAEGVYKGQFLHNERSGQGEAVYCSGKKFVGQWKNDERCGVGKLYEKDGGVIYEGEWQDGEYNGFGREMAPDGSVYEGGFVEGQRHGLGLDTPRRGDQTSQQWDSGMKVSEVPVSPGPVGWLWDWIGLPSGCAC